MRRPKGWKAWIEDSGKIHRCRWKGKYGTGQKTFVFKADAKEFRDQKKSEFQRRDAGLPLKESSHAVLLSDASSKWLAIRERNPRKNTYIKDKEALDQFQEWTAQKFGPSVDLAFLNEPHVYNWKDWLYEHYEYSHATVRMRLAHFKPFVKWCKRKGWIAVNFAADVEMPQATNSGRVLSEKEIQTVYSIPPHYVVLAFTTLLNSGMRKGEVVSLRKPQVEQVAEDHWRVHFEAHQTKNNKPKTVVLHPAAQAAVAEAMAASKTDKLFENVTEDVFDYWMVEVQKKLGKVRLHDFKHTFCTHWMRATGDIHGLQQMTGNSMSSLRIYIHLAAGTPRGMATFKGFVPIEPLNAKAADQPDKQKT